MGEPRKRRANGEESRQRILDAAAEVAGERGYDGTSIAQVSARCGLPASSIYWHFKDKDELIAAVIEQSFVEWMKAFDVTDDDITTLVVRIGKALVETPDFLRLGLMLTLERRPQEASARRVFLDVRAKTLARIREMVREHAPGLADRKVELLAVYAMAAVDGFFVAVEIGGDAVDLDALFELHGQVLVDAARRLTGTS
ncbi:TetR/AcrR family transcriptional regulator [Kutzneria sp. CA-103260]|uniref:TetR/AcrR family transcriptional regulator n=1 Tax=Kutzneria sp. CA-103260 TaxID=2802641 RepID=UPI001BA5E850|nr:TetR/AcrR family transcriptional regulator [Kutzneria sp. CA-103260]QUQ65996.1 HTH-type transcriptional regulator BetI [Kutzneria sp. CA-103260]